MPRREKLTVNTTDVDDLENSGEITLDDPEADEEATRNSAVETGVLVNNRLLQKITFNIGTTTRRELLEGNEYLVCPMVMLTEGVHAGSNGPLYYPNTELAKTPVVWDHKPIVLYHPTQNGSAISACSPAVISRRKLGQIFNTKYVPATKGVPAKLTAEAWLNLNQMEEKAPDVLKRIQKGEMVEVSTGLFTDNEQTEGLWKKEKYTAVARNYRPDHLAVLPDEKGACSIADGAGLMRNEASYDDIRSQLQEQLTTRMNPGDKNSTGGPAVYNSCWITDLFSTFCVYSTGKKMMKQGYTVGEDGVAKLNGSPQEVVRKTQYRTLDGNVINTTGASAMTKKQIVSQLIANDATGWDNSDREFLMGQPIEKLEKMLPTANKNPAESVDSDSDNNDESVDGASQVKPKKASSKSSAADNAFGGDDDEDDVVSKTKPKRKASDEDDDEDDMENNSTRKPVRGTKPVTLNQYVANAPPEIQDMLKSGLRMQQERRDALIETITANEANTFTDEYLATKDLEELTAIAALATNNSKPGTSGRTLRFTGQGDVATGGGQTTNTKGAAQKALPIPQLNFNMDSSRAGKGKSKTA